MVDTSPQNRTVPTFLRWVTIIECLVLGTTATVLFFLPVLGKDIWAWSIPPFNSRYIGAIYYAAFLPLVVFAIVGRWSPGRLVLWMIFTFTASIGVVMFLHIPNFDWARPATFGFWFLYIFLPINSAIYLYRLRDWQLYDGEDTPTFSRILLWVITVVLGLYGIGLLIAPEAVTSFWPWKIDAFHGHIYAATFITPAMGAWIIRHRSAASERSLLGSILFALGLLALVGVIWTNTTVPEEKQFSYASLGTWSFLAMNGICSLAGLSLILFRQK